MFSQPPCSYEQAGKGESATNAAAGSKCLVTAEESFGKVTTGIRDAWIKNPDLQIAFDGGGTEMSIDGSSIAVSNSVNLLKGEVLTIKPPTSTNGDSTAQWYWQQRVDVEAKDGKDAYFYYQTATAGVNAWATPRWGADGTTETVMAAPESVMLFEYNLAQGTPTTNGKVWWDLSSVDGINVNGTMQAVYNGDDLCDGGGGQRGCEIYPNLDECPYEILVGIGGTVKTCGNPKHLKQSDGIALADDLSSTLGTSPDDWATWEKPADSTDCATNGFDYCDGKTNKELAGAPSGNGAKKPGYHVWWRTNDIATTYLNWLQRSGNNFPAKSEDPVTCQTYGWAYDEMKWNPGDEFDTNGNPTYKTGAVDSDGNPKTQSDTNAEVTANVSCGWDGLLSLDIDILYIMHYELN